CGGATHFSRSVAHYLLLPKVLVKNAKEAIIYCVFRRLQFFLGVNSRINTHILLRYDINSCYRVLS
ncbi:MAG TPA: hypothetical protein DCL49_09325, partial [Candidatus Omnitrophica bacterium]|nr:hypothetical protein [Candidatus Omnitrophota bacterium]